MKILRPEINIKGSGGLTDIFDDVVKAAFNITDEEYDFICENATDEDLDTFVTALGGLEIKSSFTDRRKGLIIRNKYLDKFNKK